MDPLVLPQCQPYGPAEVTDATAVSLPYQICQSDPSVANTLVENKTHQDKIFRNFSIFLIAKINLQDT